MRSMAVVLMLIVLALRNVQAQDNEPAPYLYYYSQMLGGLIIERADGTDSRHIAADVIPPGMTGLAGPGWSPSGKYFAVLRARYSDSGTRTGSPYVINRQGESVSNWLNHISVVSLMQWSPTGEDLLLIAGKQNDEDTIGLGTFFWLIDVENGELLVDFGANLEYLAYDMSEITWDVAHEQIVFYLAPNTYDPGHYYRVTLRFDGTTLREPVDADEFQPRFQGFVPDDEVSRRAYRGEAVSPSGRYEALGIYPSLLTDTLTKEVVELPVHSQGTNCRVYHWSADEQYIITLNGTLRAGGGCAGAVMGVTDSQGHLWRELGGCSWNYPPCVDWLPERIDVSLLPPGSTRPIQLDPVRIDYEDQIVYSVGGIEIPYSRFRCAESSTANIVDIATEKMLYRLNGIPCPYSATDSTAEKGLEIITAYDPVHDLLATYTDYKEIGVRIWINRLGRYVPVLRLNTYGYQLEFTDEGQFLRARNVHGWKVYAVADILEALEHHHP